MATTTNNKQKRLGLVFTVLGKKVGENSGSPRPVLEQFIYAICRESATPEQGDEAYGNLRERFFDWNEVRVSSVHEIADALAGLADAESRAQRIIDFLQEVFETTFSFDLEAVHKKGVKLAAKQLARYQSANDYVTSSVVQHSLGGHAIPLDEPSLRTLRRLGLLEEESADLEAVRAGIEHQVPKAKGAHFVDLISVLAKSWCHDEGPDCASCPMAQHCPTGQDMQASPMAAASRKPR